MPKYSVFSVLGIELEYMLVNQQLEVQPQSDVLLRMLGKGQLANEVALNQIAISNELVMHVIELKTNGPKKPTEPLGQYFQETVRHLNALLAKEGLQLLPTGAHPWMNPQETKRWPYDSKDIYEQYDKIFDCRGHGFANLQSTHLTLPFANDEEFRRLHNAIRLILPLIPALAASSPFLEGKPSGYKDLRLYFYGKNQAKIPAISGQIIPDFSTSPAQYRKDILEPMYEAIRPFDPEGILQHEWLNSRAAIPKFAYHGIEIRILDTQECVKADLALVSAIIAILKKWYEEHPYYLQKVCDTKLLKTLYDKTLIEGLNTPVESEELYQQWGLSTRSATCREIWEKLIEAVSPTLDQETQLTLEFILKKGNLSERLLSAYALTPNKAGLKAIYQNLALCLAENELFEGSK